MKQNDVIGPKSPGVPSAVSDALTDLLRDGARQMPAAAAEAEVREFPARHQALQDEPDEQGRQRAARMATRHSERSRPDWAILKSRRHGCGIRRKQSSSVRRFCRRICGAPKTLRVRVFIPTKRFIHSSSGFPIPVARRSPCSGPPSALVDTMHITRNRLARPADVAQ
jgi:hypothetical protein